jgi:hypothetical protein
MSEVILKFVLPEEQMEGGRGPQSVCVLRGRRRLDAVLKGEM